MYIDNKCIIYPVIYRCVGRNHFTMKPGRDQYRRLLPDKRSRKVSQSKKQSHIQ